MTQAIRYLSEADVVGVLDMPRAIDALADTLTLQGHGSARNVPKALATWGEGSSMHALGSVVHGTGGVCGFKNWVHTRQGGGSVFTLFDADRGTLLAVIEARALGMLRTAAITGVATRTLAPQTSRHAALVGTGPQAVTQLAALAAVRNLQSVRVYSPTPDKRAEFVRQARPRYAFSIEEAATLEHALEGAEIVTLITRAEQPFVNAAALRDCRHLNAVGAILPAKAEFTQDVFERADLVIVDDLENARRGSRELREHFGTGDAPWHGVSVLSDLLANGAGSARPAQARMTLFKAMGMGLSDLALARVVYQAACDRDLGQCLAPQTRENLLLAR
ncbi:ornithine cyclodeaminase family protein [Achromobacter mucicolens]|uniref:ornithine cyclodeaminase family protein n=1 Tax=Achromobacter mucicolens TaxID=1389922 RepID=UPI0024471975|nr:ornithine cyclodeaminase family protein [Achromobacter mucicolens]MDH0091046.1 ornithine cyclodeaminase family protein [Achromobacter mucicolens]